MQGERRFLGFWFQVSETRNYELCLNDIIYMLFVNSVKFCNSVKNLKSENR